MGITKLSDKERSNWKDFHIPGCSLTSVCSVNKFSFSKGNSLEHERAKFEIAFEIWKNGSNFLMEAERNSLDDKGKRRIVDCICLFTGVEFEIETSFQRAQRFLGQEGVCVVPVNWSSEQLIEWELLKKEAKKRGV